MVCRPLGICRPQIKNYWCKPMVFNFLAPWTRSVKPDQSAGQIRPQAPCHPLPSSIRWDWAQHYPLPSRTGSWRPTATPFHSSHTSIGSLRPCTTLSCPSWAGIGSWRPSATPSQTPCARNGPWDLVPPSPGPVCQSVHTTWGSPRIQKFGSRGAVISLPPPNF